jgi:hypothetical protein
MGMDQDTFVNQVTNFEIAQDITNVATERLQGLEPN